MFLGLVDVNICLFMDLEIKWGGNLFSAALVVQFVRELKYIHSTLNPVRVNQGQQHVLVRSAEQRVRVQGT